MDRIRLWALVVIIVLWAATVIRTILDPAFRVDPVVYPAVAPAMAYLFGKVLLDARKPRNGNSEA